MINFSTKELHSKNGPKKVFEFTDDSQLIRQGIIRLLEIKDAEIRLLNLFQCEKAIDSAIHIGGASSATIPMVSLFYGGIIRVNVEDPTAKGQDQFVLSKGHAVATLASIYADLGYFDKSLLENSRSVESVLNGHPGPLLPGVHVATGPMGQGLGVAQGFAITGQLNDEFDVYALTGDGELQEGPIWESVMYAGAKKLENLCVLVDNNGGQLDSVSSLHFPYHNLGGVFENFGWRVMEVDATRYHAVYDALYTFKHGSRDGRPTVIICKSQKGFGGFSNLMNNHKSTLGKDLLAQESNFHLQKLQQKKRSFCDFINSILSKEEIIDILQIHSGEIGWRLNGDDDQLLAVEAASHQTKLKKVPARDNRIYFQSEKLPAFELGKSYSAHKVIEDAMKVFAMDPKVFSVDSDLASTSGLQAGVGYVDKNRALNVGVAEANMMLIGEATAIMGYNTWVSTFCPFFDWKVLRRIAVGHQERLEVIAANGWLSEGHALDYTFVATAADLETQSNGATHMGNDDVMLMSQVAHLKIINVSCPQQLLAVMKWIMEGGKGLIYLRLLRAPSKVLYSGDFEFSYGKSYPIIQHENPDAYIISSSRGVYESIQASELLLGKDLKVDVIDMPSVDKDEIIRLRNSARPVYIVEQNNGYLWSATLEILATQNVFDTRSIVPLNLTKGGEKSYIHSGTYDELAAQYGVDAKGIVNTILQTIAK